VLASRTSIGPSGASCFGELLLLVVTLKKTLQQRQDGFEGVAPSQVGDDLLFDVSLLADRSDDANVFVDSPGRTTDLNGADEHDAILASLFIVACQDDYPNITR
jgi:hypothetical protein